MSMPHVQNSGAKVCLPIDMNIKLLFYFDDNSVLKLPATFVSPAHIRTL